MPVMDGLTATRTLRAAGYASPIVALTANVMHSDVASCREAGCDDVLAKPIDREAFYEALAHYVSKPAPSATPLDDLKFQLELDELAQEFRAGLPAQIDAVRHALRQQDWDALASLMHTLKGTAGSYGYPRLTELAAGVEAELRARRPVRAALQCEGMILEAQNALHPKVFS